MDMTLRGFAVKGVYIRIETITIARVDGGAEVGIELGYYANAQCLERGMSKSFTFPYTNGMSIIQEIGYTALKSLPEFAGAVDV